jgi:uncharacterized membrane protein YbhN (UPF0104 family)
VNRRGTQIRNAASFLIILGVAFFFTRAFQRNWAGIRTFVFEPDFLYLALSFLSILITYLLMTFSWFLTLNALSGNRITFLASVAAVNTSNLMKYVPGKVWSYALQMYWLVNAGYSKSLVLYVNLITLYSSVITATILGLGYLLFSPNSVALPVTVTLLTATVVFDLWFIHFHAPAFKNIISFLNRVLKRDIGYFSIPRSHFFYLHGINFLAAFCFGISAYFLCLGIGFDVAGSGIFSVMSSMMLSDVIGFMAIIVPGGLGIREGVMYFILKGDASKTLSLILPIASRIVNMLVDITLGTVGIVLLKKLVMVKR